MAHRSSAGALHAARLVLEHNTLTVRPPERMPPGLQPIRGLLANEAHVSILIDKTTNVYRVVELRPELRYWQLRLTARTADARQLCLFLKKLVEALELVPHYAADEHVPHAGSQTPIGAGWGSFPLTKASVVATGHLWQYYELAADKPLPEDLHRLAVAKLIEIALRAGQLLKALPNLRLILKALASGQLTEANVQHYFHATGILMQNFPCYQDREEETKLLLA